MVVHGPRVGPRSRGPCCSARSGGGSCSRSGPSGGRVRRGRWTSTASWAGSRSCSSASTSSGCCSTPSSASRSSTCSSPWRRTGDPGAVAFGVVGMYLVVAVEVTSLFMRRLPRRVWHSIHLLSLVALVLVTVHTFTAGADASSPLVVGLAVMSSAVVAALGIVRVVLPRPRPDAVDGPPAAPRPGRHRDHPARRVTAPAAPRPAPPLRPGSGSALPAPGHRPRGGGAAAAGPGFRTGRAAGAGTGTRAGLATIDIRAPESGASGARHQRHQPDTEEAEDPMADVELQGMTYLPQFDTRRGRAAAPQAAAGRRRSGCSAGSASTRASPATSRPATPSTSTTSGSTRSA